MRIVLFFFITDCSFKNLYLKIGGGTYEFMDTGKTNELRLSSPGEVEELTKISIEAFHSDFLVGLDPNDGPPDYDSLEWHKQMQAEGHLYSFANENGTIIGGAVLFASTETVYIGRIFVSPEYQRRGYGIKMMAEIESMFSSAKLFKLDTPANNIRTNSFYRKLGYVQSGVVDDCAVYIKRLR